MLIHAVYNRPVGDFDETRAIEVEAECFVDVDPTLSGRALAKSLEAQATLIIWTDATREKLARLGFDGAEFVGATEAIDDAFDCYRARLAQQTGDQAFFDKRNAGRAA